MITEPWVSLEDVEKRLGDSAYPACEGRQKLINRFLAEDDFNHDTQLCLHWFDQPGRGDGVYGEADVLARAKATSVNGLAEAGVVHSGGGKVRLLRPAEYPAAAGEAPARNELLDLFGGET
jgi:putative DNA methylase